VKLILFINILLIKNIVLLFIYHF